MKGTTLLTTFAGSLTALACAGVSSDYVAVNAATIHTNSESTLATLEGMKCENDTCVIQQAALDALKDDQRQIRERAQALCTAVKANCKFKP